MRSTGREHQTAAPSRHTQTKPTTFNKTLNADSVSLKKLLLRGKIIIYISDKPKNTPNAAYNSYIYIKITLKYVYMINMMR